MTRNELRELLIHAEIDDIEIDGPSYDKDAIYEIRLDFKWRSGEKSSVLLQAAGDSSGGWIAISEVKPVANTR